MPLTPVTPYNTYHLTRFQTNTPYNEERKISLSSTSTASVMTSTSPYASSPLILGQPRYYAFSSSSTEAFSPSNDFISNLHGPTFRIPKIKKKSFGVSGVEHKTIIDVSEDDSTGYNSEEENAKVIILIY